MQQDLACSEIETCQNRKKVQKINSNKNHKQKRDHTQNQIKVSCLLKGDHQISGKKRDDQ